MIVLVLSWAAYFPCQIDSYSDGPISLVYCINQLLEIIKCRWCDNSHILLGTIHT